MAEIERNLEVWTAEWEWPEEGDEWSAWWGDTPALWYGALLPRIHAFVPTGTVLEIAPGFGRWTQYLKDLAERLIVVDLTERCIEHCRERFAGSTNIEYHVNDGRSLEMVPDGSIDFVFSFDSLVHAEGDIVDGYVEQLSRKLTADGVGFIHHSNAASYRRLADLARKAPPRWLNPLVRRGVLLNLPAWRDETSSADAFARQCEASGLRCIGQEKINWEHGRYLIDSLSMFTRPGSRWDRPRRVVSNPLFTDEARRMTRLYARSSYPVSSDGASASRPDGG